ncbi:MAG: ribulose-phosphate 3-epimerase, partial [Bacteroidota bacterium]
INALGMKSGVSLNPHTPIHVLEDIIEEIDMVLLMSVNPGFGGQKFISNTYKKIRQLKELTIKNHTKVLIEIDGGVDAGNAKTLVETGADVLVAGSFVFKSENPVETVGNLKNLNF